MHSETANGEKPALTSLVGASAAPSHTPAARPQITPSPWSERPAAAVEADHAEDIGRWHGPLGGPAETDGQAEADPVEGRADALLRAPHPEGGKHVTDEQLVETGAETPGGCPDFFEIIRTKTPARDRRQPRRRGIVGRGRAVGNQRGDLAPQERPRDAQS